MYGQNKKCEIQDMEKFKITGKMVLSPKNF